MLVVTNRHVTDLAGSPRFSAAFSPVQATLSLAQAVADAQGSWSLQNCVSQADDTVIGTALLQAFTGSRPVLLYIHGNNNTPEACFARCATLETMYDVTVIGFSWPSEGQLPDGNDLPNVRNDNPGDDEDLSGVSVSNRADDTIIQKAQRYRRAKDNAQESVDALARFLRLMAMARLQASAQPFSVAAHSLGSHFLQYTLEIATAREALGAAQNIALVAPCVRAAAHADWVGRLRPRGQVFVTYNEGDSVLFGAYIVDGNQIKLGTDPGSNLVRNGIVRYVCFTRSPVGFGGHGYFVYGKLAKKTRLAFKRMFSSEADIQGQEYPRQVYVAGCDADGAVCYVGVPTSSDGG